MSLRANCRSLFLVTVAAIFAIIGNVSRATTQTKIENRQLNLEAVDGVKLRAYLMQPVAAARSSALAPAIILANPWSIPPEIYMLKARHLAEAGYVVLGYASRGFGGSGGTIDAAGPKDLADMSAWIDWLVAYAGVDPTRIGIAGISYGGALALMAATHDERIKAVVSLSGWIDIGRSLLYDDGTVTGVWGDGLLALAKAFGHFDPQMEDMIRRGMSYQMGQEEVRAWSISHSPVSYLDLLNRRAVPIMFQHNMDDNIFWASRTINFFNRLTGPKKLIVNLGEHSTPDFMGAFGVDNKVWDNLEAWFDHYLKGKSSSLFSKSSPITVQVKRTQKQLSFASWPGQELIQEKSYDGLPDAAHGRGALRENASSEDYALAASKRTIINGRAFGVSPGNAMLGPLFETHFNVPLFKLPITMDPRKVITFVTPPLDHESVIFGAPTLTMTVIPTTPKLQLVAYLYSVDPGNILRPIAHGPATLLDAVPGVPRRIQLTMLFTSYAVPKGSKIMLAIGTYDPYYRSPNDSAYQVHFVFSHQTAARLTIPYLKNHSD